MINKKLFFAFFLAISLSFCLNSYSQDEAQVLIPKDTKPQELISLDLKGMDIVDVLKTLAMRSGLNIVVGKNVVGKVTIFLKDVEPRQALDIILLANDLAYEENGNIINVMTNRDYEARYGERFSDLKRVKVVKLKYAKATPLVASLNQIKSQIGKVVVDEGSGIVILMDTPERLTQMAEMLEQIDRPTETKVFDLNYSNSEKLKAKINEMTTKNIGSITIDERTNKIIVVDYPEKIQEISKMVEAFDSQTKQVLIDSKIIEVTLDDHLQLGIDWDYWIKEKFRVENAFPLSLTTGGTLTVGTTTITTPGQYNAVIEMLDTYGDTQVLSSPRVTAINNQEAKILVGSKEAYITQTTSQAGTGSTITAESVNFVDVGVQLYVTPSINKEGFVTMKIRPVVSSATYKSITSGGTISQIPIVATSEAETSVLVKDGSTIIIAGLIKDEKIKTTKKIPILGDIPLLGNVFKSTDDEVKKKELVIFLTPHILTPNLSETKESALEFKKSLNMLEEYDKPELDRILSLDTDKPGSKDLGYVSYLSRLRRIIAQNSARIVPKEFKPGEVEVSFILTSDGKLKASPQILSATEDSLKGYALSAVISAAPFPPFPSQLQKDEEKFDIVISFVKE